MENVIDSVYPPGRNDTQILWKSWGYPGSIEKGGEDAQIYANKFLTLFSRGSNDSYYRDLKLFE